MSDDALDQNLRNLLNAAPERARLSTEARERIRAELSSAWPEPVRTPVRPTLVGAEAQPRLRLLPRLVAVAAALLLVALGASKLMQGSSSNAGPDGTGENPAVADSNQDAGKGPGAGPVDQNKLAGTARPGDDTGADLASPDGQEGRVPGLDAATGSAEGQGTGDLDGTGSLHAREGAAASPMAVLASVEMEVPASMGALPSSLTLWVKAVVQLPKVADPVAFEVPFATDGENADGRIVAQLELEGALAHVHAMGSKNVLLQVEVAGMAPSRALVSTDEAAAGTVRFVLEPGLTFSGTVVDVTDGSPVQGALVVALDQLPLDALAVGADLALERLPQPHTTTDALGRYTLRNVAREDIVRLRASGGEYAPTIAPVAASEPEGTTFELGRGTTVAGIVEQSDGTRWENAVVVVSLSGRDPSALDRPAMTYGIDQCDSSGEFSVTGLPAGNYVALVFDPADRETPVEFRQLRIKGAPLLRLDFLSSNSNPVAGEGLTLEGILVGVDGRPLPAESLSISSLDGQIAQYSEWRVADTGAGGEFRFPGISASSYVIHRVLDGFERMTPVWEGRIDSSQTLRIALADTHVSLDWRGASTDGRSWTILERWRTDREGWDYAGSAPTTQGRALRQSDFDHLPTGRYRAVLMGPGHGATWSEAFEVEPGRDPKASTALHPGASLPIRVTDAESGQVIDGAIFKVLDEEGRQLPQREALTTDLEGLATQLSVPFGRITIQVFAPARAPGSAPSRGNMTLQVDFSEALSAPMQLQLDRR